MISEAKEEQILEPKALRSLLTIRDVRERLNVSQACVYSLIQTGALPHIRIGLGRGTIRIDEEDLRSFIDNCRTQIRPKKEKQTARASFSHLDAEKLRKAWREQGGR